MQTNDRQYERTNLNPPEENSLHRLSLVQGDPSRPAPSIIAKVEKFDPVGGLVHCVSFDGKSRYRGETLWVMPLAEFLSISVPFAAPSTVTALAITSINQQRPSKIAA